MADRTTVLAPLRDRPFRRFWLGQTLSETGNAVVPIALTLAVLRNTGSATDLGIVLAVLAGSEALCYVPAGVWADRLPLRTLMCGAEILRAAGQLVLGTLLAAGSTSVPALSLAAAATGAGAAFFRPAVNALMTATTPSAHRQQANALLSLSRQAPKLLGPAIATGVVLTVGPQWIFFFDAATFLVSALLLSTLTAERPAPRSGSFRAELAEGWTEVRSRRWYWSSLIVHGSWNFGRCAFFTVGPLVVLGFGGEVAWGAVVQGAAVGALLGALIAFRLRPRRPLVVANLLFALGALPFCLLALHAPVALVVVSAALMNSALGVSVTLWDTVVQERIPVAVMSRVSAYDWLFSFCLSPVGFAVAGPLALAVGNEETLLGAAALLALPGLLSLLLPDVRGLRTLGDRADQEASEPVPDDGSVDSLSGRRT